jgi:Domain of unknown function (DUF4760)
LTFDPATAVAISTVIFATAGWLWNGRLQRSTERRKHTYSIVALQQADNVYRSAIILLRGIGPKGLTKKAAAALPQEDIDKLDHMLNHYEFLAAAIWCGDVDEKLIRMCDETLILALRSRLKIYMNEKKKNRDQPSMWEHMDNLATRWEGPTPTRVVRLCESILQRPFMCCPKWLKPIDALIG